FAFARSWSNRFPSCTCPSPCLFRPRTRPFFLRFCRPRGITPVRWASAGTKLASRATYKTTPFFESHRRRGSSGGAHLYSRISQLSRGYSIPLGRYGLTEGSTVPRALQQYETTISLGPRQTCFAGNTIDTIRTFSKARCTGWRTYQP